MRDIIHRLTVAWATVSFIAGLLAMVAAFVSPIFIIPWLAALVWNASL